MIEKHTHRLTDKWIDRQRDYIDLQTEGMEVWTEGQTGGQIDVQTNMEGRTNMVGQTKMEEQTDGGTNRQTIGQRD